jgi:hypothetical protein
MRRELTIALAALGSVGALGFGAGVIVGSSGAPAAVAEPVLPSVCTYVPPARLVLAAVDRPGATLERPFAEVGQGRSYGRVQTCEINGHLRIPNYGPNGISYLPEPFTALDLVVSGLPLLPVLRSDLRQNHRLVYPSGLGPGATLGIGEWQDEVMSVKGPLLVVMFLPTQSNEAKVVTLARYIYAHLP